MKKNILAVLVIVLLTGTLSSCFNNSSKEVLHAFIVINIGLMQQKENIEQKNAATLYEFENQVLLSKNNPRTKSFRDHAFAVHKESDELDNYIRNLKIEMVAATDRVNLDVAKERVNNPFLIHSKGDYYRPTNFFGTNKPLGKVGKANDLKIKLQGYKKFLLDFVGITNEYKKKTVEANLNILDCEVPQYEEHKTNPPWEMFYFYHLPQSAALAELTRWQLIVRDAEHEILTYLYDQISASSFKFDEVLATIIPKSNIVTSGSMFEAEVFLQAYSSAIRPIITYGTSVDSLTSNVVSGVVLDGTKFTNDGRGHIRVPTSGTGERTCEGVITLTHPVTGKEQNYIFKTKYKVVAK